MKVTTLERTIACSLAASTALQGVWMGLWSPGGFQWYLVSALAALAAYQAWMARNKLPAHLDMLLLMGALGGLGMMIGTWIDKGFPLSPPVPPAAPRAPSLRPLATWMTWLMLLFAVPAGAAWSRCLAPVRRRPGWLAVALLVDVAGMLTGMILVASLWTKSLMRVTGSHFSAHHLAMLAGMLGGMLPAMLLRDAVFRLISARPPASD
jgi:hypothetical protein